MTFDRRTALVLGACLSWITAVLVLDAFVDARGQALLGVVTWTLLVVLLVAESPLVRAQVAVVVVFATVIEYTFSPLLDVYTYRLGGVLGVPSFVPPGHGLVYLAALTIGRAPFVRAHARPFVTTTVVLASGYALWGLFWSPRPDVLGAFWCA